MPATPALDQACAALAEAGRRTRRQRIRLLSRSYDRARHLPAVAPMLCDRPGHPFAKVKPEYLDPALTKFIMRGLARAIASRIAQRHERDVEMRIDMLRVALHGELRAYAKLRRRELFAAAAE